MPLTQLEHRAMKFSRETQENSAREDTGENRLVIGLATALAVGRYIHYSKLHDDHRLAVTQKTDGTPVTSIDIAAELFAKRLLNNTFPEHGFTGEEHPDANAANNERHWAIDPIDATNAFVANEETAATTLALFRGDDVGLGIVYNPFTDELFYAFENGPARLLRDIRVPRDMMPYGAADDLPLIVRAYETTFANTSAMIGDDELYHKLHLGRRANALQKVTRKGGSPAWNIASVGKSPTCFVTDWKASRPTAPWDLAAAIKIVRAMPEGQVTDLAGNDIPLIGHTGPLVASAHHRIHDRVLEILNR